jgi:hypothetical protein
MKTDSLKIKILAGVGMVIAASPTANSGAATLTSVPMQGSMVMPMLSYHADDGRMHVVVDPTVPQLTPLLISNPGDNFNPADPWCDFLDPGCQGRSFSRRYGFVMDTGTDPLPAGTAMWIRKLSGSSGLSAYRYKSSEPKAFEPIFGTDGATNAMCWNGMMFHPAFTAPPGTNGCTATFEACLVDTATGVEVPETNTGSFELNWTNVPDGRPELGIGQGPAGMMVFWPTNATNYVLEGASVLAGGTWTRVTNAPAPREGQSAVVLDAGEPRRFFRMKLNR